MTSSPLRSEKLDLRLTPGANQTLQRAAAAAQRSVTDFVLKSALASAAETLADRTELPAGSGAVGSLCGRP